MHVWACLLWWINRCLFTPWWPNCFYESQHRQNGWYCTHMTPCSFPPSCCCNWTQGIWITVFITFQVLSGRALGMNMPSNMWENGPCPGKRGYIVCHLWDPWASFQCDPLWDTLKVYHILHFYSSLMATAVLNDNQWKLVSLLWFFFLQPNSF